MVYIKRKENPLIFKQPFEIKKTSNQKTFRKNYLQEFIKQQSEMNSTLTNASDAVKLLVNDSKNEQKKQFNNLIKQLEHQESRTTPLIENMNKQEEAYKLLLQRFENIDKFNSELIKQYEHEGFVNQAIVDQLTIQDKAIQKLTSKIEHYDILHHSLSEQLEEQQKINNDILKTLELQESFHKTILERIDHQEALSQKLSRDLETLKATLFERISYVVEKVEENYKTITNYVTQLFTKSGFIQRITVEKEKKPKDTTISK